MIYYPTPPHLLWKQILIQRPFRERRRLLRTTLPPLNPVATAAAVVHVDDDLISNLGAAALLHAKMDHVESVENSAGREAVEEFWEKAVESKCEGLMIKVRVWSVECGVPCLIRGSLLIIDKAWHSFLIPRKSAVMISIQERT